MSITGVSSEGTGRTWRLPVMGRAVRAFALGFLPLIPAGWLAITLMTNGVADGGWIALAIGVAIWGLLAWRALTQSVTLTQDSLLIRNVFTTETVPLAHVTEVAFRRGQLRVTVAHGPASTSQHALGAVPLSSSRWTGLPDKADAIARTITDAVGLPPAPPRRQIISLGWARFILSVGVVCLAAGVYCGALQPGPGGTPFALREVGSVLLIAGAGMSGLAIRVLFENRRNRTRQASASE
jgi:hypothetical protein